MANSNADSRDNGESPEQEEPADTGTKRKRPEGGKANGTNGAGEGGSRPKNRLPRGQKACLACRQLKMRCVDSENPPCQRCRNRDTKCVFTDSGPSGTFETGNEGGAGHRVEVEEDNVMDQGASMMAASEIGYVDDFPDPGEHGNPPASQRFELSDIRNQLGHRSPSIDLGSQLRAPFSVDAFNYMDSGHQMAAMGGLGNSHENGLLASTRSLLQPEPGPSGLSQVSGNGSNLPEPVQPQASHAHNDGSSSLALLTDAQMQLLFQAFTANEFVPSWDADDLTLTSPLDTSSRKDNAPRNGIRLASNRLVNEWLDPQQIEVLFQSFFNHINPCWSLLLPAYHTPERLASLNPFLLLTVCMIAARFFPPYPGAYLELYDIMMQEAMTYSIRGPRTIETAQSYLLLAMYAVHPFKNEQEDLAWSFICFASRLALDLKSNKKADPRALPPGGESTVNENRMRTWWLCYALDKRTASFGKIEVFPSWDNIRCPESISIIAYAELQSIVTDSLVSMENDEDTQSLGRIAARCYSQLTEWSNRVEEYLELDSVVLGLAREQRQYIRNTTRFYFSYWNLVICSFVLENAISRCTEEIPYYMFKCAQLAMNVIEVSQKKLAKQSLFRFSTDSRFVFLTYAAITLLKLLRPDMKFPPMSEMSPENVLVAVASLARTMKMIAVDQHHMAGVCAALLQKLISRLSKVMLPQEISSQPNLASTLGMEDTSDLQLDRIVTYILQQSRWQNVIVPGFDHRDRDKTEDVLREWQRVDIPDLATWAHTAR